MTTAQILACIAIVFLVVAWAVHRFARRADAEMQTLLDNARRERGYPTRAEHEQRIANDGRASAHLPPQPAAMRHHPSPSYSHPKAARPLPRSAHFVGHSGGAGGELKDAIGNRRFFPAPDDCQ